MGRAAFALQHGRNINTQLLALNEEFQNYWLLAAAGHKGPQTSEVIEVDNHLTGAESAALVVEHIEGTGPLKVSTQYRTIMRCANRSSSEIRNTAKASWSQLQEACKVRAPMDLQIIFSTSGEMVVIDPEKTTTTGNVLKTWDDSLV